MFEKKIREKSLEAMKRDHETWLKKVREKKLIPEGGKKGGPSEASHEVEKSTDVNLERPTDEQVQQAEKTGETITVLRTYNARRVQEKVDEQITAMSNLLKLSLGILAVTVFLFFLTLILTTRKIHRLEDSIEELRALILQGQNNLGNVLGKGNGEL
jgi:hypothetical protein